MRRTKTMLIGQVLENFFSQPYIAAKIAEGRVFIADLIGLPVFADGVQIGILKDVYTGPANDVYMVSGEKEYMIPAVSEFLLDVNVDEGYIKVKLLEGMDVG